MRFWLGILGLLFSWVSWAQEPSFLVGSVRVQLIPALEASTSKINGKAWIDPHSVEPTWAGVSQGLLTALEMTEAGGIRCLATPVLGLNVAHSQLTPENAARAMLSAIYLFALEGGTLDLLQIVMPADSDVSAAFHEALDSESYIKLALDTQLLQELPELPEWIQSSSEVANDQDAPVSDRTRESPMRTFLKENDEIVEIAPPIKRPPRKNLTSPGELKIDFLKSHYSEKEIENAQKFARHFVEKRIRNTQSEAPSYTPTANLDFEIPDSMMKQTNGEIGDSMFEVFRNVSLLDHVLQKTLKKSTVRPPSYQYAADELYWNVLLLSLTTRQLAKLSPLRGAHLSAKRLGYAFLFTGVIFLGEYAFYSQTHENLFLPYTLSTLVMGLFFWRYQEPIRDFVVGTKNRVFINKELDQWISSLKGSAEYYDVKLPARFLNDLKWTTARLDEALKNSRCEGVFTSLRTKP